MSTPPIGSTAVPRLTLAGITKRYPSVVANDGISLTLMPGEIHAVLGENGAGKSTLRKIIYGAIKPDAGSITVNGQVVQLHNPQQARELGISMVFQHFSLFNTLSVAENVWLGLDASRSLDEVARAITEKGQAYGLDIDPHRPVHTLSVGEMQRVELIRALLTHPKILILDEPTSVLTPQAVDKLFTVLRRLAAEGCSILYISHKLHEIRALCHTCTVLRGGKVTGHCDPSVASNADLSRLMIGTEPPALPPRATTQGATVLQVQGLSILRDHPFGVDLQDVNLDVRAGEVLGIAGVSGNGQKELLLALSGEDVRAPLGSIKLDGQDVSALAPMARRHSGLHFVPEDRLGRGAVPALPLHLNLLLTRDEAVSYPGFLGGFINTKTLKAHASKIIARFGVKAGGPQALARSLSGGNLQKFLVGREIDAKPKVLIISQPTWGVDVGAAALIRTEILALRDAGCAVLVVSEELDELFELSDRMMVMSQGQLSPAVRTAEASTEHIGAWMSGLWKEAAHAAA
jgi:ABC-type uncharacterized transport system ATPase subunit